VDRFYAAVAEDPVLRPLYPEDLTAPSAHLAAFLVQYWGGPDDYRLERGHPRLRMRHVPFAIGFPERDAWFRHMSEAVRAGRLTARGRGGDDRLLRVVHDLPRQPGLSNRA